MPTFSLMAMQILAQISTQNEKAEGQQGFKTCQVKPVRFLSIICQLIKVTLSKN